MQRLTLCLLCVAATAFPSPKEKEKVTIIHVNNAPGPKYKESDGSIEYPFLTLEAAKLHLIRLGEVTRSRRVLIQPGVYPSLAIDHPMLSSVSWEGVEAGSVISGGIEVPSRMIP